MRENRWLAQKMFKIRRTFDYKGVAAVSPPNFTPQILLFGNKVGVLKMLTIKARKLTTILSACHYEPIPQQLRDTM